MSVISITKLYDLLCSHPGKDSAENLTTFIAEKIQDEMENKTQLFTTKEDLASTKADIIKWMFIFWIGQLVATFGFILLFLNK
jgi:hypothetical protein